MEEAHDDDISRVVDAHDRRRRVDLEDLVPARTLAQVDAREAARACVVEVVLRSHRLAFHVEDRRQLWQAYGQEFIEPDQLDWIDSLDPGSCLIDAGASTGIFAVYAAARGVDVIALEPDAANFAWLVRNASLNGRGGSPSVSAFCVALSDVDGVGMLRSEAWGAGLHRKVLGHPAVPGGGSFVPSSSQAALQWTLDGLVEFIGCPQPRYLKIDVDGSECALVAGASATLQNPMLEDVFIEIDEESAASRAALRSLLGLGFEVVGSRQVQHYRGLTNYLLRR